MNASRNPARAVCLKPNISAVRHKSRVWVVATRVCCPFENKFKQVSVAAAGARVRRVPRDGGTHGAQRSAMRQQARSSPFLALPSPFWMRSFFQWKKQQWSNAATLAAHGRDSIQAGKDTRTGRAQETPAAKGLTKVVSVAAVSHWLQM